MHKPEVLYYAYRRIRGEKLEPKVFISHASEDKDRFVLEFAMKLRSRGIDAWLDRWEIYPGDSLIDKIFEQGIKDAQAVIVVISKFSVNKPWVREELNAALVKKINGISKLIPVVIDDCQVPESLKTTLWEKIKDLNKYDDELDRIVMSIYGQYDKPPLGLEPAYTQTTLHNLSGLTKSDSLVMNLICEKAIKIEDMWIGGSDLNEVSERVRMFSIPQQEFKDALRILNKRGYLELSEVMGGDVSLLHITVNGFEKYAKSCVKNYNSIVDDVISCIVNKEIVDNKSISKELRQNQLIIDHILRLLASRGLIHIAEFLGGSIAIHDVSPELKRVLRAM